MNMEFQKIEFRDTQGNYINGFKLFQPTTGLGVIPKIGEHINMFSQFHNVKHLFTVVDVTYEVIEYRIIITLKY